MTTSKFSATWRHTLAATAVATMGSVAATVAQAEDITFITSWKAQAEHGGHYQAVATGLYKKYGLNVKIRPGGPGVNTRQLIAAGAVDFGMGSNNDYLLELAKAGAGVKAVMASMQKSPQILMTHPGNGINKMEDMKDKPILMSSGNIHTMFAWMKAKYGFTNKQIRKYTFNMAPFIANKATIQQGYLSSEPFTVKNMANIDAKIFLLADHGYATYASLVMVPEKWITNKRKAVDGFVKATIEGWYSYLYGDPSPGNALIKKDNPDMKDSALAYGIRTMKAHGIVDSGDSKTMGIGAMTKARWQSHFDAAVSQGIYPKDLSLKDAYTLEFVNQKHGMM